MTKTRHSKLNGVRRLPPGVLVATVREWGKGREEMRENLARGQLAPTRMVRSRLARPRVKLAFTCPRFGQSEAELECEPSHCSSPAMSFPHLFSLSHEFFIEIFSNLCPFDIYACRRTCRQLNELIVNSQLLQYISRTALSGVFDPLEPGLSLPDRLDALERWETA
ncbi:hypothetical protein F5888DRAFT_1114848 [Russula emetica]|nr:hypothetical protein F5888DRAFT_1114848 [Russula emetica]